MDRRLLKQIIYLTGYLTAIFLVLFVMYLIWFKPAPSCFDAVKNQGETGVDCGGPCASCEIGTLAPFKVSWVKNFPVGNRSVIAAEIKNPNLVWGADNFSYTFDVYDISDNKIYALTKSSFIYANEIKYLAEPNVGVDPKRIGNVKLSFSDINWKSQEEFIRPETQTREIKIEQTQPIKISGLVLNNNSYSLFKLNVLGFLYNQKGNLISASKTELGRMPAFEEEQFQITFPPTLFVGGATSSIDFSKTQVYVEAIR